VSGRRAFEAPWALECRCFQAVGELSQDYCRIFERIKMPEQACCIVFHVLRSQLQSARQGENGDVLPTSLIASKVVEQFRWTSKIRMEIYISKLQTLATVPWY